MGHIPGSVESKAVSIGINKEQTISRKCKHVLKKTTHKKKPS